MNWAVLLTVLLKAFNDLVSWLHDRELLKAGQAEAIAAEHEKQLQGIRAANAARAKVLRDAASVSDIRVLDDPFRRDD